MPDRQSLPEDIATPAALRDAVTRALPHGVFSISAIPSTDPAAAVRPGVLRIECRCGRALRWVGTLPSDILIWWLADHDDDMFLTPAERERKYGERLDRGPFTLSPGLPSWMSPLQPRRPEDPAPSTEAAATSSSRIGATDG